MSRPARQATRAHRARLWWGIVAILGVALALSPWQTGWAQPHQDGLRDTINTPVATPTSGPSSTPSPTVVPGVQRVLLQEGRDGYDGTQDTYIDSYTPRIAPVLDGGLRVKGVEKATLIRFDLQGQLPPGTQILDAELTFYVDVPAFTIVRALDVSAFRMLRSWDEAEVSWNYVDSMAQTSWAQAGANGVGTDRVGVGDDTIELLQRAVYRGLNVTESVRYWYDHPDENYGWLIAGVSSSTGSFTLSSSRHQTVSQRPVLRIDYTLGDVTLTPTKTPDPNTTATATASPMATSSTPSATPRPTTVALDAVQDCYIDEWYPEDAHDYNTLLCRNNGIRKILIQFDLSGLPPLAQVTSATLRLKTGEVSSNLIYVNAYRLLTPWLEGSATWKWPQMGQVWGSDGANAVGEDYDPTLLDRVAVDMVNHSYEWDVTEAAQSWVQDGEANQGLLLVGDTGPLLQWGFASSEHSVVDSRPVLIVQYALAQPTATPTRTLAPTPTATETGAQGHIVVTVFDDTNGDRWRNVGEPGIAGALVRLLDDAKVVLSEGLTDLDGRYQFGPLAPGWYRVQEQDPAGYRSTTDGQVRVYVGAGSIEVPFGDYRVDSLALPLIVKHSAFH